MEVTFEWQEGVPFGPGLYWLATTFQGETFTALCRVARKPPEEPPPLHPVDLAVYKAWRERQPPKKEWPLFVVDAIGWEFRGALSELYYPKHCPVPGPVGRGATEWGYPHVE